MGADRSQWQFPKNEAGKAIGWKSTGKGLENKSVFDLTSMTLDDVPDGSAKVAMTVDERGKLGDASRIAATRTALGGLDPTQDGSVRLVEDGFQGEFLPVDPAGYAALVAADSAGGEIKATANPSLSYLRQRKYGDLIRTSEFGHDLSVSLAVASERRTLFGADATVDVLINQTGSVLLNAAVRAPQGVNVFSDRRLNLLADNLVIPNLVDMETGLVGSSGRTVMDVRPLMGVSQGSHYSAPLPSFQPIAVGDIAVTFDSAHGRVVGDVLVWYSNITGSWNPARPEYRLSMRRRVVGVDGLKVYMDKPAYDAFVSSADLLVRAQTTRRGRYGGFTLDMSGLAISTVKGIVFTGLDDRSEVSDINIIGAGNTGVSFNQCLGIRPSRIKAGLKLGSGSTSTYPIQIANSTDVTVLDSEGYGDWHALSMTGGGAANVGEVINEDCWYERCKAFNTGLSTTAAGGIEMHGNADRCGYRHCDAAGAILGGRDPSLIGGSLVNLSPVTAFDKLVLIGELHSGRVLIDGTTMRSIKNTGGGSSGGMLYFVSGQYQVSEVFVDVRGVHIEAPNEIQPMRFGCVNAGTKAMSLSFDGDVSLPAANTFCQIVTGNTAITSSYFRLERVAGLKSGCNWAASTAGTSGHMAFTEIKYPKQQVTWTTSGVAAASELSSGNISWPHGFPSNYTPSAAAFVQSNGLGNKTNAKIAAVTFSAVRPMVATGDGTNMTAAASTVVVEGW